MCTLVNTATSAAYLPLICNLIDTLVHIEEVKMEMSNSESSAACIIPNVSVLKLMLQEEQASKLWQHHA